MAASLAQKKVLDLLAVGNLDGALALLERAESGGTRFGVNVLIPLARALLAAGRNEESLALLERASVSAAFGGELDQIITELGFPRAPGPSTTRRSAEGAPSKREPAATTSMLAVDTEPSSPDLDTDPDGGAPDDGETDRHPLPPSAASRTQATGHSSTDQTIDRALEGLAADEGDTDEVGLPESPPIGAGGARARTEPSPAAADSDERFVEARTTIQESSPPSPPLAPEDTSPTTTLPDMNDDDIGSVTAPFSLDVLDGPSPPSAGAEVEDMLSPGDVRGDDAGRVTLGDSLDLAEISGDPGLSLDDSTTRVALPEAAAGAPPAEVALTDDERTIPVALPEMARPFPPASRRGRDQLQAAADEARALRASTQDATSKLSLPDIEVIGHFQSGTGTSTGGPRLADGPDDLSGVPDSEELRERRHEQDVSVAVDSTLEAERALASHKRYDTTRKLRIDNLPARSRGRRAKATWWVVSAAIAVALGLTSTALWLVLGSPSESSELARARDIRAQDTFESHEHALALLSALYARRPHGEACGEYATQRATMAGRFGLGDEHRAAAAEALDGCPEMRDTEPFVMAKALLSLQGDDRAEALHRTKRGLERYPQSARLRAAYAEALLANGEREAALRELRSAARIAPDDIAIGLALAACLRRLGRHGEARTLLDRLARRRSGHVEIPLERLTLELDAAPRPPTEGLLRELRRRSSDFEALTPGQPPAIVARIAVARGRVALLGDNVDHAGVLFGKARRLAAAPDEAALYITKGLRLSGDLSGALEVARAVRRDDIAMTLEHVRVLLAIGRPREALELLHQMPDQESPEALIAMDDADLVDAVRIELAVRAHLQDEDPESALATVAGDESTTAEGRTTYVRGQLYLDLDQGRDAQRALTEVTGRPWDACAEAARLELLAQPRRALEALDERGVPRAACTLQLRARLARGLGDGITEISSLRSLLRVDPRPRVRLTLIRAVWRERGITAALAELQPVIDAAPTGSAPLNELAELLAPMQADQQMAAILEAAGAAGAPPAALATARARFERLRGRYDQARQTLASIPSGERPPAAVIESAAVALASGRAGEVEGTLAPLRLLECSPAWVRSLELRARALAARGDTTAAEGVLDEASRACAERGAQRALRSLLLTQTELGLERGAPASELRARLARFADWPPSARRFELLGRLEEREANPEVAIVHYRRALEIDAVDLSALRRLIALTDDQSLRRQLVRSIVAPPTEYDGR